MFFPVTISQLLLSPYVNQPTQISEDQNFASVSPASFYSLCELNDFDCVFRVTLILYQFPLASYAQSCTIPNVEMLSLHKACFLGTYFLMNSCLVSRGTVLTHLTQRLDRAAQHCLCRTEDNSVGAKLY